MPVSCTPLCFTQVIYILLSSHEGVPFLSPSISFNLPGWWRNGCRYILAFFWLSGLMCGILCYHSAGDSLNSLMRGTLYSSVSIVSLLGVTILPFLLSVFAVYYSLPALLLPICFIEAFLFSFVSFGLYQAFFTAGWLIRCLLLFSDCICAPFLYWLWLRYLPGNRKFSFCEALFWICLAILIGSLHYSFISPF